MPLDLTPGILVAVEAAATPTATPWWQTALTSLLSSVLGAGGALFGVWLNGRMTDKRERRKDAADETAKRIDLERNVIGDVIALTLPWSSAIHARYLQAYFVKHRDRRNLKQEVWDKAIADSEKFAAAIWKARVTVKDPATRAALDQITEIHHEFTQFISKYEEKHTCKDDTTDDQRLDQLESDLDNVCRALESAALALDPPLVDAPAPDVQH